MGNLPFFLLFIITNNKYLLSLHSLWRQRRQGPVLLDLAWGGQWDDLPWASSSCLISPFSLVFISWGGCVCVLPFCVHCFIWSSQQPCDIGMLLSSFYRKGNRFRVDVTYLRSFWLDSVFPPLRILYPSFSRPLPFFFPPQLVIIYKEKCIWGHLMNLLNCVLCSPCWSTDDWVCPWPVCIGASVRGRRRTVLWFIGTLQPCKVREGNEGTATLGDVFCSDLRASAKNQISLSTCFCSAYDLGKAFTFFK